MPLQTVHIGDSDADAAKYEMFSHTTSKKLTALYNTTYITADTVVALLERIAK